MAADPSGLGGLRFFEDRVFPAMPLHGNDDGVAITRHEQRLRSDFEQFEMTSYYQWNWVYPANPRQQS